MAGSLSEAISYEMATRSWIIERGNFLFAGYASTRGYASKIKLRVPVFVLFCGASWIIERGNFLCAGYASTRGYASKLMLSFKGTSVRIVLSCKLDHRTRQYLMC